MRTRSSSSVRIFYPAFDRAELVRRLTEGLGRLESSLPLVRVVLFGSWARGAHTVGSDVDLLVVYRGDRREDAYALTKRALAVPRLEPHLSTEAEYEAARATVERMERDGIVLFDRPC
jgi:predicted nucleotidyltransferase